MAATIVRNIGSKLSRNVKEIRIHLCQKSAGSQGVRDFVEQNYVTLKKANPEFPILIRECSEVQPKLWARYGECLKSKSLQHSLCRVKASKDPLQQSSEGLQFHTTN
ncbi:unnamed protein product, partial [Ranitomeya imitator]